MKELFHIIGGKKVAGSSDKWLEVNNPATGEVIRSIRAAGKTEVDQAVQSAKKALPQWSATTPAKRAQLMFSYRELLYKNLDELATLISQDHGKTLADAKGEVMRGVEVVEFCTNINDHLKSDYSYKISRDIDSYNVRHPLGVCAGITPFNFPAMVPMWMFPIAISCGNTFVLKASEKTPSCSLRVTELLYEAGLPEGVLNTVIGEKEAVDAILTHPDIHGVSFVGSTPVGEYIYQEGCKHNKRVQALCGAKNHLVVMPDANVDLVCSSVLGAAYGSAGERCMAVSVLVVVGDDMADAIVKKLSSMIRNLKIGPYDQEGVELGPVVTQQSYDKILKYIDSGIKEGAELVVDGRNIIDSNGYFIGGCLFDRVESKMSIYTDEIFGPVLSLVRVNDYKEALSLVDSHEYGNGASIFTRDGGIANHFSQHAQAGMVGVNVPIPVPVAIHSFGGWKRSLFGGSSIHGMEGVRFYTKLKTLTCRWPEEDIGAKFHFSSGRDES